MSDWRTKVNFIDKSQSVVTDSLYLSATAIKANKGPEEWVYFPKGSTQKIIEMYGYPSSLQPSVQDVIDANQASGIFVNAPSTSGKYAGAFLTKVGTIPFVSGTTSKTIADYEAVDCVKQMGVGDGVNKVFTLTLPNFAYYNHQSIDILVDGTSVNASATDVATEVITTDPDVGDGTLVRATGVLTFTFDTAPLAGEIVSASYTIDISSIVYCTFYRYSPQADDFKIQVIENEDEPGTFTLSAYLYDESEKEYLELSNSPFNFSLDPTYKDGFGNNIYVGNIFGENQYQLSVTVQNETFDTYVDDATPVVLIGGNRGSAITGSDLAGTYDDLTDKNTYPVAAIWDSSAESAVATKFSSLRGNALKYTRFYLPTADLSPIAILANPASANNGCNDRGIRYYCLTWGIHTDTYLGRNFNCSNMGLIMNNVLTILNTDLSVQPAYINENGVGGQLGAGIVKLNQIVEDEQLQQLDRKRFNPVVIDPNYGPMIVGWRTTQSRETVYAYDAQSSQADAIITQIIDQVLTPQKGKANDDYHRSVAKSNTENILSSFSRGLDAFFVKCDRENNNDDVLNRQEFVLSVAVRFIGYASTLTLNYISTKFGVDIEESLN